MKTPSRGLSASVGALLLLPLGFSLLALGEERVVAVGDVHGDFTDFAAILQQVGLIDASHQWTGGTAVFVQTGDVPDRGPQSRAAFDLLMSLEPQAEKQNGKVIPLLGNHEVMDMLGDLRYVSPEDYQTFSTDQSEKVREEAYQDYKKFLSYHRGHRHSLFGEDEASRQKWMAEHPLGFFEEREAMGPQGVYGRWLRKHDAIAQVDDTLFMHGGLDPKLHFKSLRELNDSIRKELANFDSLWEALSKRHVIWRYMTLAEAWRQVQEEYTELATRGVPADPATMQEMQKLVGLQTTLLLSPNSPLWYRGYALEPEDKLKGGLNAMMARLKFHYIVAGHTVRQKFNVTTHFDKHIFLIDTGMLKSYFGGRASALVIQNGNFTAIYEGGEQEVLRPAEGAASGTGGGAAKQQP